VVAETKKFILSGCVVGDDIIADEDDESAPACMGDCPSKCTDNMQSVTVAECSCIQGCDMSTCDEMTVAGVKNFVLGGCVMGADKIADDYVGADTEGSDVDGVDNEGSDVVDDTDTAGSDLVSAVNGQVEVVVDYAEAAPNCMVDSVCVNTCIPDPFVETISTDACSCIRQCDLSSCSDDDKTLILDFLEAGCIFREVVRTSFSCGRASADRAGPALDTFSFDGCDGGSGA
jgi:hypothetical protein